MDVELDGASDPGALRARLIACVRELHGLLPGVEGRAASAETSARRMARALAKGGRKLGHPQLTATAAAFDNAPRAALPMLVRRLVCVLEEVIKAGWDEKLHVLVVQSDEDLARELAARLRAPNREVLLAETAEAAWRAVDAHDVALVVLDLVLPDVDGRNLLVRLRGDPRTRAVPVVVLSAWGGHKVKAECFALGADAYFERKTDLDLFAVAAVSILYRALRVGHDSHHDALSKLLSRDGLRERLESMRAQSNQRGAPLTLALLDLELPGLERAGYTVTEAVHELTPRVLEQLRPSDALGRWNERELVALLGRTDRRGAVRALERVREALEELPLQGGVRPRFQAGVVEVAPHVSLEEAVGEADRELEAQRLARLSDAMPLSFAPRVLVVDPDDEVAFTVRRTLGADGYEVRHCTRGAEALALAKQPGVALVLLDLRPLDMDGFEALERLRQRPGLDAVPIALMTPMGRDRDVARAFQMGADDYVLKPCSAVELAARLRRLLRRRDSTVALRRPQRPGAVAGLFSGDQLYEFVQMLGLNAKTGRLQLGSERLSGHVDFHDGRVVCAHTSRGERGRAAAERLLEIEEGSFEFQPGPQATAQARELDVPASSLLMDVLRRRDERERTR